MKPQDQNTCQTIESRLEDTLRHLKYVEPNLRLRGFTGESRSINVDGIFLDAHWFEGSVRHMLDGVVVGLELVAKRCLELEQEVEKDKERIHSVGRSTGSPRNRANGAQSRRPGVR